MTTKIYLVLDHDDLTEAAYFDEKLAQQHADFVHNGEVQALDINTELPNWIIEERKEIKLRQAKSEDEKEKTK